MKDLIIFCSHPGLIRAGVVHPQVAVHDRDRFTPVEYAEMLAEPSLVLAFGALVAAASMRVQASAATPFDVGLQGPTGRVQNRGMELGLPSGVATRHVADEVVLRDATSGHAMLRSDGTAALPADAALVEGLPRGVDPANLADELAVRAIEDAPRDIVTGQPAPAPLADDIVAQPGDTEVERRVEDVAARAVGRHRARRG